MTRKRKSQAQIPGVDLRYIRRPFAQAQYMVPGGLGTARVNLRILVDALYDINATELTEEENKELQELRANLRTARILLHRAAEYAKPSTINRLYELRKLAIKREHKIND